MSLPACLLIETLLAPERAPVLTMAEWETLIGQARASQLLIRLATVLGEQSLLQGIAPAPRRHLESTLRLHQRQLQADPAFVRARCQRVASGSRHFSRRSARTTRCVGRPQLGGHREPGGWRPGRGEL